MKNLIQQLKDSRNPFLIFLPFLILYILYVIKFHNDTLEADEARYLQFANNLLHGFYSPPAPDIDLWCGPGYPIFLMPFAALGLPMIAVTLVNSLLHYLSIVLLFKSLIKRVSFKLAFGICLFWGLCFSSYDYMALMHTETFTIVLVALFIYSVDTYFTTKSRTHFYLAGVVLGFIVLTKILFAYVILVMLIGCGALLLLWRSDKNLKGSVLILLIAFATTVPYLLYTYNLTGRLFYWGNSGGMSLYWMSTPHENEFGDWNNETFTGVLDHELSGSTALLKKTHQADLDIVTQYSGLEKDDAYKEMAIANIKSNPKKYVKNIIANLSRSLFGFPYSYSFQRPQIKIWYFAIFFTVALLCFIITVLNWNEIEFSARFLLALGTIYWGGSLLISMYNRMLLVVIPIFLFWMACVLYRSIRLEAKFKN